MPPTEEQAHQGGPTQTPRRRCGQGPELRPQLSPVLFRNSFQAFSPLPARTSWKAARKWSWTRPSVRSPREPGTSLTWGSSGAPPEPHWRVEEPPRSIALVWDNSGSVTPFKNTLYPSLLSFTKDVMPGREFVNLLPFQDSPAFLLEEWSDRPYELLQALNDYERDDGSSDAELNLRFTVEEMMEREGTKAVVFLTDADSPASGSRRNSGTPFQTSDPASSPWNSTGGTPAISKTSCRAGPA